MAINKTLRNTLYISIGLYGISSLYLFFVKSDRGFEKSKTAKLSTQIERELDICIEDKKDELECQEISDRLDKQVIREKKLEIFYRHCLDDIQETQAKCQSVVDELHKGPMLDPDRQ